MYITITYSCRLYIPFRKSRMLQPRTWHGTIHNITLHRTRQYVSVCICILQLSTHAGCLACSESTAYCGLGPGLLFYVMLYCILYHTRGRYHGGRRPSSDDSFHSPTVIPPSTLDKPSIMKRYHRRRTCSHTSPRPMVTLHGTRFVECRWWKNGWTVETVVT